MYMHRNMCEIKFKLKVKILIYIYDTLASVRRIEKEKKGNPPHQPTQDIQHIPSLENWDIHVRVYPSYMYVYAYRE